MIGSPAGAELDDQFAEVRVDFRVLDHAGLAAQRAADGVESKQRLVRRPLAAPFPHGESPMVRVKSLPLALALHNTEPLRSRWFQLCYALRQFKVQKFKVSKEALGDMLAARNTAFGP
jgi:hypothetical protein